MCADGSSLTEDDFWALCQAVSADEGRANLTAPYCDGQSVVATDGYRLHYAPAPPGVSEGYGWALGRRPPKRDASDWWWPNPKMDAECQFPSWRAILPEYCGDDERPLASLVAAQPPRSNAPPVPEWSAERLKQVSRLGVVVCVTARGLAATLVGLEPELPSDAVALCGKYFAEALRFVAGVRRRDRGDPRNWPPQWCPVEGVTLRVGDPLSPVELRHAASGRMAIVMSRRL